MGYKLIALDLDGTLLTRSGEMSDRVLNALISALEKGAFIAICTGRRFADVKRVLRKLRARIPLILHNGAMIAEFPSGDIVARFPIPPSKASEAIKAMKRLGLNPFVYALIDGEVRLICENPLGMNPSARRYVSNKMDAALIVDELERLPDGEHLQIVAIDRREKVEEGLRALRGMAGINVMTSGRVYDEGHWFLEILDGKASKAEALRFLSSLLGIPRESIAAVGDNYNDIPMFRAAGLSFAMGNAPEEVRSAADRVAPSNEEDGAAWAIEEIISEEGGI